MSIVRDDRDERETRVDRMVDELRNAQSRRLAKAAPVKGGDQVVELVDDIVDTQRHSPGASNGRLTGTLDARSRCVSVCRS